MSMRSYGSEGEWVGKGQREMNADGGKVTWDWVFKIVQAIVIPLLLAVIYQINSLADRQMAMDRRLTLIEAKPAVDFTLLQKVAVMEDRQNEVRVQLRENGMKLDRLEDMLLNHDETRYKRTR